MLVHGEGDDLPYVRFVRQQHDDAVNAGCDAAVERGTVAQGADHAPEPAIYFPPRVPGNLKRLVHDVWSVIADGTARQFEAVAYDVVLMRLLLL